MNFPTRFHRFFSKPSKTTFNKNFKANSFQHKNTFFTVTGMNNLLHELEQSGYLKSPRVKEIMTQVDRKKFCGEYYDSPQAIGYNQTISAPHMHAMCLEILSPHLQPGNRALDVGSGSGYMTACFALMVGKTGKAIGIEIIENLLLQSKINVQNIQEIKQLHDSGVLELHLFDGWNGYPTDGGGFDAIHVGAAAETIPKALVDQLNPGGCMVIPVGRQNDNQYLLKIDKKQDGTLVEETICGVRYVPLVKNNNNHKEK